MCLVYEVLVKNKEVPFHLYKEAIHKVESLVSSINSAYFGNEIYKTAEEKAVAYFYFIIKNHPFIDGNKRTATLVFYTLCEINGLKRNPEIDLDAVAIFIEKSKEQEYQSFIGTLSKILFE